MAPSTCDPGQHLYSNEDDPNGYRNLNMSCPCSTDSDTPPEFYFPTDIEQLPPAVSTIYGGITVAEESTYSLVSPTLAPYQQPYIGEREPHDTFHSSLDQLEPGAVPLMLQACHAGAQSSPRTPQYDQRMNYSSPDIMCTMHDSDGLQPMDEAFMTGMLPAGNQDVIRHASAHPAQSQMISVAASVTMPTPMIVVTSSSSNFTNRLSHAHYSTPQSSHYQHANADNLPTLEIPSQGSATSTVGLPRWPRQVALPAVLKANENRRTRAAPFRCPCGQTFTTMYSRKRHIRSHMKRNPQWNGAFSDDTV